MSSLNRIISGTLSGLTKNFFTVIIGILSLPIYPDLSFLDQKYVIKGIKEFLK